MLLKSGPSTYGQQFISSLHILQTVEVISPVTRTQTDYLNDCSSNCSDNRSDDRSDDSSSDCAPFIAQLF